MLLQFKYRSIGIFGNFPRIYFTSLWISIVR